MRHIDDPLENLQFHTIQKHKNMFHEDQDCVVLTDDVYDGVVIQYDIVQSAMVSCDVFDPEKM